METWSCPECGETIIDLRRRGPHLSACRRSKKAKYLYLNGDTKHPYEFKACLTCGIEDWIQKRNDFCSLKCSKQGKLNPQWKGEHAGYISKHMRVYRLRGSASSCVWGCTSNTYEWANLTGRYEDPNDYASMCKECHSHYDMGRQMMEENFSGFSKSRAKLTKEIIVDARRRRAAGEKLKDLAIEYRVAESTLSLAINGKQWRWTSTSTE